MQMSLESGYSSVVTRWTIDQEVVGLNPRHGRKLYLFCALALRVFHSVNEYRILVAGVLRIKLELKILVYVLR